MNWTLLASWPLPFAVVAALSAAMRWQTRPGWGWVEMAAILVLNFAIVYAVIVVAGRLLAGALGPKQVGIATLVAALVCSAVLLPRPQSGWVRVGVGDALQLPGMMVHGVISDLTFATHREAMLDPARLERALRGEGGDRFRVERATRTAGGWMLDGALQEGDGLWAGQVVVIDAEGKALGSAVPDDVSPIAVAAADGRFQLLTEDAMGSWGSDGALDLRDLPEETSEWLRGGQVVAHWDSGWHIAVNSMTSSIATIDETGRRGPAVALPFQGEVSALTRSGGRTWVLATTWGDAQELHAIVLDGGVVDEGASAEFAAALRGEQLQPPFAIVGGESAVWIVAYQSPNNIVLRYPGGQRAPLAPGRFLDATADGDAVVLATTAAVLRFDADMTPQVLGEGRVVESTISLSGGVANVGMLTDGRISLVELHTDGPVPFRPGLVLWSK